MKLVGAAAGGNRNHSAGIATHFRREHSGLDPELLDRIRGGDGAVGVADLGVLNVSPIDGDQRPVPLPAGQGKGGPPDPHGNGAILAELRRAFALHGRSYLGKVVQRAARELGQGGDHLIVHHVGVAGVTGVDPFDRGRDLDGRADFAGLQHEVDTEAVGNPDHQIRADLRLESLDRNSERVGAGQDVGENIDAGDVRLGWIFDVGGRIQCDHRGSRNRSAGGVGHQPGNLGCRGLLAPSCGVGAKRQKSNQYPAKSCGTIKHDSLLFVNDLRPKPPLTRIKPTFR